MREIKDIVLKNGVKLEDELKKSKPNLSFVDLRGVDLRDVDLSYANLNFANLSDANLRGVDLSYANLNYANLSYADLRGVDLSFADLRGADLSFADLSYADLRCANLRGVDLNFADLREIRYNESTSFFALQCPQEGSFIGYKCADNKIIKLLITEDAKRSSATSRKCRCSKAKVLSIESIYGKEKFDKVESDYDRNFIYEVGKIVEVKNFDENRWNECSTGIHFFITRQEAVNYI